MIEFVKGNRGLDFLRCFKDMSIKHASEICGLCFSTFRMLRQEKRDSNWFFVKLKSGDPKYVKRWDEIKLFRERMMLDSDFINVVYILRHAAEFGAAMKKVIVPKAKTVDEPSAFKKGISEARQHIPVAPSFNDRDRLRTWALQQQRLIALTQEAMHLVATLPPQVPITVPAPQPAPVPVQAPVTEAPPVQPEPTKEQPVNVNSWSQLSDERWVLESVATDATYKKATPREINRIGQQQACKENLPPSTSPSKGLQLRPEMIVFDLAMEDLRRDAVQRRLAQPRDRTPTPLRLVFPDINDLGVVKFPKELMLGQGAEPDVLPNLEPITDWGWLHTMGLAMA